MMIAITRGVKFKALLALIVIALIVNGYFYFYNQNYLKYILFWAIGFMLLAAILSYQNGKRLGTNSLGRVWILFGVGLLIWTFTNVLSTVYSLAYQRIFPYFWALVVIDLIGYAVFAYMLVYMTKFVNLIRISKRPRFPWMRLAFLLIVGALSILGVALTYAYIVYRNNYLFLIYLFADMLIAGSMLLPLLNLKHLSIQRPFALFIFGFILLIAAESTYFLFVISGIYEYLFVGSPQHFLYMLAFGVFALGAYDQKRQLS